MHIAATHALTSLRSRALAGALTLGLGFGLTAALEARPPGARTLEVALELRSGEPHLSVREHLELPAALDGFEFELNAGLAAVAATPSAGVSLRRVGTVNDVVNRFRVAFADGADRRVTLAYAGQLALPSTPLGNYADGEGLWLSAASAWFAQVTGSDVPRTWATRVLATAPSGWQCLSQGANHADDATASDWRAQGPQANVHLVCGHYERYERMLEDGTRAQVWLLTPDVALAERYLGATETLLPRYEALLGEYPYSKFALLEARAPVGYGMPSFTMIGSRVIRLPFILTTSYPHELVHNWFGNGVYADVRHGNWTEGLTTYLADHADAEARAEGVAYRRKALYRVAVESARGDAYPVTQFRARASRLDSSIGYDRVMMLFHMLRVRLGDEAFRAALRELSVGARFEHVHFLDIRDVFQRHAPRSLDTFFAQWLTRSDLPILEVRDLRVEAERVRGTLVQTQPGKPFELHVPIVSTTTGAVHTFQLVRTATRSTAFDLPLTEVRGASPPRIDVDPFADVLREVPASQRPPLLAEVMAKGATALIHPDTPAGDVDAYRAFATALGHEAPNIGTDAGLGEPTWLLGSAHAARPPGLELVGASVDEVYADAGCTISAVAGGTAARAWVACDGAPPSAATARRLRHYGNRGLLAFPAGATQRPHAHDWHMPASLALHNGASTRAPTSSRAPLIAR